MAKGAIAVVGLENEGGSWSCVRSAWSKKIQSLNRRRCTGGMIGLPEPAAIVPPTWAVSWFPVAIDSTETEPNEPAVTLLARFSRPRILSIKEDFAEELDSDEPAAESLARFLRLRILSVRDGFFGCSSSFLDMVMRVGREHRRWLSLGNSRRSGITANSSPRVPFVCWSGMGC